jgi:hypothetical protein
MKFFFLLWGSFLFLTSQAWGIAWVADAIPKEKTLIRLGYEALYQKDFPQRQFSSIHTIQVDLEKQWESVRLFVTNIGFHFGLKEKPDTNTHFADDARFGAQFQFKEVGNLHGGIRFWTKLPNTDDATGLGTDETDFWFMVIQSYQLTDAWSFHINGGLAIIGAPNLHQAQNDWAVGGLRIDWLVTPQIPVQVILHGFSGFRENDDKLSIKIRSGYQWLPFSLFFELQTPLVSNLQDYADPLDHTATGGMILAELNF